MFSVGGDTEAGGWLELNTSDTQTRVMWQEQTAISVFITRVPMLQSAAADGRAISYSCNIGIGQAERKIVTNWFKWQLKSWIFSYCRGQIMFFQFINKKKWFSLRENINEILLLIPIKNYDGIRQVVKNCCTLYFQNAVYSTCVDIHAQNRVWLYDMAPVLYSVLGLSHSYTPGMLHNRVGFTTWGRLTILCWGGDRIGCVELLCPCLVRWLKILTVISGWVLQWMWKWLCVLRHRVG